MFRQRDTAQQAVLLVLVQRTAKGGGNRLSKVEFSKTPVPLGGGVVAVVTTEKYVHPLNHLLYLLLKFFWDDAVAKEKGRDR